MQQKFYYLIGVKYLGFRYHGWQKQPKVRTVQGMIEKTVSYVLDHDRFKTLGASRTDKMVSCEQGYFELFTKEPIDEQSFMRGMEINLPPDIQLLSFEETDSKFNIIHHPKEKEYRYYFSFGEKPDPFCAPFLHVEPWQLEMSIMHKAAAFFVGEHNFLNYCIRPSEDTQLVRSVDFCEIQKDDRELPEYFPEDRYMLVVRGKGFLRNQVRLMMGVMIALGRGEIDWATFEKSFDGNKIEGWSYMAAPSALVLYRTNLV